MKKNLLRNCSKVLCLLFFTLITNYAAAQQSLGCIFEPTVVANGAGTYCENEFAPISFTITGNEGPYTLELNLGAGIVVTEPNYNSGDILNIPVYQNYTITLVAISDAGGCTGVIEPVSVVITMGQGTPYYADADNDGFGNGALTVNSCSGAPAGYVANSLDCDDTLIVYDDADFDGFGGDVFVPCLANGVLNSDDCDDATILYSDDDNDGFGSNTLVACGGVSNTADCNDALLYYLDVDNDGFGSDTLAACDGEGVLNSDDCNDNLVLFEDLDGDGYGSEIFASCSGVPNSDDCDDSDSSLALQGNTYYQDLDNDGFGNPLVGQLTCTQPVGYVLNSTDCDDTNPAVSGGTTYYRDLDGDGFGDEDWPLGSCTGAPAGYVANNTDCADNSATRYPGATEIQNNLIDDDCDGEVDEALPTISTQILPQFCGATLTTIDQYVFAALVPGVQGYQWRVTTLSGPNAGEVQTVNSILRNFKFSWLNNFAYNTTYKVEVTVRLQGTVLPYPDNTNCIISTPSITTQMVNCNDMTEDYNEWLHAFIVRYAAGYRFRVTQVGNPSNSQEVIRPLRAFRLRDLPGLSVNPGSIYTIEVAVRNTDQTWLPYGPACQVAISGFSRMKAVETEAIAYPNPFSDQISIDVTFSGHREVSIQVYDLMGRTLEKAKADGNDKVIFTIGQSLPTGVYHVAIQSGDETETIRIVKR